MREIGGFFELETGTSGEYYHQGVKLNSARNCLRYLVCALGIRRMYTPAYTCPVIWQALEAENCEVLLYNITSNFLPEAELDPESFILYTNYFGICTEKAALLAKKYPRLIVDNAQAFFALDIAKYSFNSPRKFFGVPDGGYFFGNVEENGQLAQDVSLERTSHLLKRIEFGATAAYGDFRQNDDALINLPVRRMSRLTERLLQGIDYSNAKKKRRENYQYLHRFLSSENKLDVTITDEITPMVYPFLPFQNGAMLKRALIEKRIFVATYWTGQKDFGFGSELEDNLVPLPIDQRYDLSDMERMVKTIRKLTAG